MDHLIRRSGNTYFVPEDALRDFGGFARMFSSASNAKSVSKYATVAAGIYIWNKLGSLGICDEIPVNDKQGPGGLQTVDTGGKRKRESEGTGEGEEPSAKVRRISGEAVLGKIATGFARSDEDFSKIQSDPEVYPAYKMVYSKSKLEEKYLQLVFSADNCESFLAFFMEQQASVEGYKEVEVALMIARSFVLGLSKGFPLLLYTVFNLYGSKIPDLDMTELRPETCDRLRMTVCGLMKMEWEKYEISGVNALSAITDDRSRWAVFGTYLQASTIEDIRDGIRDAMRSPLWGQYRDKGIFQPASLVALAHMVGAGAPESRFDDVQFFLRSAGAEKSKDLIRLYAGSSSEYGRATAELERGRRALAMKDLNAATDSEWSRFARPLEPSPGMGVTDLMVEHAVYIRDGRAIPKHTGALLKKYVFPRAAPARTDAGRYFQSIIDSNNFYQAKWLFKRGEKRWKRNKEFLRSLLTYRPEFNYLWGTRLLKTYERTNSISQKLGLPANELGSEALASRLVIISDGRSTAYYSKVLTGKNSCAEHIRRVIRCGRMDAIETLRNYIRSEWEGVDADKEIGNALYEYIFAKFSILPGREAETLKGFKSFLDKTMDGLVRAIGALPGVKAAVDERVGGNWKKIVDYWEENVSCKYACVIGKLFAVRSEDIRSTFLSEMKLFGKLAF